MLLLGFASSVFLIGRGVKSHTCYPIAASRAPAHKDIEKKGPINPLQVSCCREAYRNPPCNDAFISRAKQVDGRYVDRYQAVKQVGHRHTSAFLRANTPDSGAG
jgi:hypothetical protein